VAAIWASGDKIIPAKLNINSPVGVNGFATTSSTDTTSSATYVNMAGTGSQTSFPFTKLNASTRIRVQMSATLYSTGATGGATLGARINGTDYDVVAIQTSVIGNRVSCTGIAYVTGVAAGTYTVQLRWKRNNGSGVMTRDQFDWLCAEAMEVA
jgi:hypothetical protein